MISMTGYGRASATEGQYEVIAEISSVNKRNLDIAVSLPREWHELEADVAGRVRGVVRRGKVYVSIRAEDTRNKEGLDWNEEAVAAALDRLRSLAVRNGVPFEGSADLLYRMALQSSQSGGMPAADAVREGVEAVVGEALRALAAMRAKEGATLAADLGTRVEQLRSWTGEIEEYASGGVTRYRELLFQRLKQAGLDLDLDDERVLKEIALFADRCDISEEITRLKSHLDQLGAWVGQQDEPVGRKAEFLVQEINREINTIGSKANDLRISRSVIDCKNELERIREQVQNVE